MHNLHYYIQYTPDDIQAIPAIMAGILLATKPITNTKIYPDQSIYSFEDSSILLETKHNLDHIFKN